MVDSVVKLFTSLKLTVVCLALAMVLVFLGTMAQVDLGIHAAQQKYFQTLFVYWTLGNGGWRIPVFPGGHLIGGVLLINLVVAHIYRFEFRWTKSGIMLLHLGIFLLLLGGLFTELLSIESQMRLHEGETKNYSESLNTIELIIVDASRPDLDEVISIPDGRLARNQIIRHPRLPFQVNVVNFFPNSILSHRKDGTPSIVTQGVGRGLTVTEMPRATKINEGDAPSVILEVVGVAGPPDTWLCSTELGRQAFRYQDKQYELQLRQKRHYKPYSIKLLHFAHDRYDGTDIPRNFSSKIHLRNSGKNDDREVLIYMNNPLRYEGETYFQAGFEKDNKTSVLQVVHNPAWITPYLACSLVALGLVIQFSIHLFKFAGRKKS